MQDLESGHSIISLLDSLNERSRNRAHAADDGGLKTIQDVNEHSPERFGSILGEESQTMRGCVLDAQEVGLHHVRSVETDSHNVVR